jgi:putative ABC transport system permease protein
MRRKKGSFFPRFIRRSLGNKKGRAVVAALSLSMATAVLVMALGIYIGVPEKLGRELKSYGANIIIAPVEAQYLGEETLQGIQNAGVEAEATPQLYGRASLISSDSRSGRTEVEVVGTVMEPGRFEGFRVIGRLPAEGEALLGANVRDAIGREAPGSGVVRIGKSGSEAASYKIAGYLETGGPEDNAVMLPLGDAQELLGLPGKVSAVLVRVQPGQTERASEVYGRMLPGAAVKTLKQVASAEVSFLRKMELLMLLFSAVIIFASAVSVSSTQAATVYERLKEMGLMKSIGGTAMDIRRFYLFEAAAIGGMGGLLGYLAGFAGALAVSKKAFNSFIFAPPWLAVLSVAGGVLVSVLASLVPLRAALKLKPSIVLRGE